ncbi:MULTISPECIES: terminase large subunit domain-containing protein [unclassified Meiothermus]|uniref:terminase large subunit domain-containing protein n=1 Tax=unclassified Meiothermus TaxID=370471 RepID=UPI000D7C2DB4|nr:MULTISPECIES: terminase family protein [unclassified Meiothermus]PZA07764.1 hypothetical protein DNA98_05510 [Meiothermus sp. Pnk-1]RYM38936.1 hypothetical protein EWH23_04185 [Meiothermus sp. PNK-Is4]
MSGILLPYQKLWIEDKSRFKIGMWSRQSGKSFAGTLETVDDSLERRALWIYLSRGERQSLELAEKAKLHLEAYRIAAEAMEDYFLADSGEKYTQLQLRLPNGSRHIFLPANPDTARGYSGNVFLDEFAFHKDSKAIWTALFPTITRNPSYRIRIVSTPNGKGNMFFQLWERGGEIWSRHRVTIYDAVAQGLQIDPEELREAIADPIAWQQEYLLEFVEESTAFIPYDLILAAESAGCLAEEWDPDRAYLGMDIGRRRDLTVIWIDEIVGDVAYCRKIIELRSTPFATQLEVLLSYLPRVRRAAIDATGLGMMLAEEARRKFGWRVEPVEFNLEVKADLAQSLRLAFEDRKVRIPANNQSLRESIHSVKRIVTSAGNVRYDAERNEQGHADHFWAKALAMHAATRPRGPVEYRTVLKGRFGGHEGLY